MLVGKSTPVQHLDCRLKAEHGLFVQELPVLRLQHAVALLHSCTFPVLGPSKVLQPPLHNAFSAGTCPDDWSAKCSVAAAVQHWLQAV